MVKIHSIFGLKNRVLSMLILFSACFGGAAYSADLWKQAQSNWDVMRFSTLFTAQNVRDFLAKPDSLQAAVQWCKDTAVTHVYLESFRGSYTADRDVLLNAKKTFEKEGIEVSGCITTTKIGRDSVNGWIFPCFSDPQSQETLKRVFSYTASLFDEIMIDDFFATGCECEDCKKAKGDRSWDDFRCDMLVDISKRCVIEPARQANPDVKIIIKYPQWYDGFHSKGYEVVRQSKMFDKIWVGTETRDPDSERWGRKAQYEAFFIMRWLGALGGEKCGGGWFDPYGTSPKTYLEQARQTILGGAEEALLFCYGSLVGSNGPENIEALRAELPKLFDLAKIVRGKEIRGVHAPKIPNSEGEGDRYIYDFIGMLGLPLKPAVEIDPDAPAAFLPLHSLQDDQLAKKLGQMLADRKPVLVTKRLAEKLPASLRDQLNDAMILDAPKDFWDLMNLPEERLGAMRRALLAPFGLEFDAPTRVALYMFGEDLYGIENFNDSEIKAVLKKKSQKTQVSPILCLPEPSSFLSAALGKAEIAVPARGLMIVKMN